jgi:gentisate 1,2-dioxygenase
MKNQTNLFEQLIKQRDAERKIKKTAPVVVKGKNLPLENNRMGLCRWYLHPHIKNSPHRALVLWMLEIPAGSHSGKQKTQGGRVHYVMEGRGYTEVDGIRYDWKQGDMILLPIKAYGTTHQHFNLDKKKPAKLVISEPNAYDALGVDQGSGFEQLENSPDYES